MWEEDGEKNSTLLTIVADDENTIVSDDQSTVVGD
jgi:hypothetical protein